MDISIIIPTFKEKENIKNLINLIKSEIETSKIIIVDDSPIEEIKNEISNLNNVNYIYRGKKLGRGSAVIEGLNFSQENFNSEIFVEMDADLSHDPKELKEFIHNVKKYPFVIGSRYMTGGKCLMKGKRLLLSKLGNMLIRNILRINLTEFTTSYRGFNLKELKNFHLNKVKTKGYSFFMGTVFEIYKMKFAIKEIPIIFRDREKGYSKIPKLEIFRTLKNLILLSLK